jgi:hypothetical protein
MDLPELNNLTIQTWIQILTNNQYSDERDNKYFSEVDIFIQYVVYNYQNIQVITTILGIIEPIIIYLQSDLSMITSLRLVTNLVIQTNNTEIIDYYYILHPDAYIDNNDNNDNEDVIINNIIYNLHIYTFTHLYGVIE